MKKIIPQTIKSLALIIIFLSASSFYKPLSNETRKINNSLIFDFFLNYELTQKNGNISTIIDFLPNMNESKYKRMNIYSNIGGFKQSLELSFDNNSMLEKITYNTDEYIYRYEFFYDKKGLLTSVNITGKPKIFFYYNKKGQLNKIKRQMSSYSYEYELQYALEQNRINFQLFVIEGNKRNPSKIENYVKLDSLNRVAEIDFDRYISKKISYTEKNDLLSYYFSTSEKDNIPSSWEYTKFDDRGNWIERKSNKVYFTREIEYQ